MNFCFNEFFVCFNDQAKEDFKTALIKEKNDWIHKKLETLNTKESIIFWKQYRRLFLSEDESFIGNLYCEETSDLFHADCDKENLLFDTFFTGKHLNNQNFDEQHYKDTKGRLADIINQDFLSTEDSAEQDQLQNLNSDITLDDVIRSIIAQKTSGKCKDGDSFHPKMLKCLTRESCKFLTKLYNICFETGTWPWEDSYITFIKKEDKKSYLDPGSYRPLTISPYIGKILERILEHRIRRHCQLEDVIDDAQEGFLPSKNTTRYLYKMLSSLHEVKRRKMVAFILLIDFEKAFDSVPIPCLIVKLFDVGIRGRILKLVPSFLSNRKVKLKVNTFVGPQRRCGEIGLPQGAVLSPLLFIIYIADLLCPGKLPIIVVERTECYKYADDGSVTVVGTSITECQINMQHVCDYIFGWCKLWRLTINCNTNKTEIIILKTRSSEQIDGTSEIAPVHIGGKEICYVTKSKVLGVTIDEDLSFIQHANLVLRNCWYAWYKITNNTTRKRGLNSATLSLLFKTVILTKLLYAAPIWLNDRLSNFKDLFARAILKITGSQYYIPKQLAEVLLGLPPIELLVEEVTIKFVLKVLSQEDAVASRILQIEATPEHHFFSHTYAAKQFLFWKHKQDVTLSGSTVPLSIRHMAFSEIELADYFYEKDQIKAYQYHQWDKLLQTDMKGLANSDPFNIEPLHDTEELATFVNTACVISNPLVLRSDSRISSSNLMDFLHGRCVRFQNFAFSVLKYDKSVETPICLECAALPDSVFHKVFECSSYSERVQHFRESLSEIGHLEHNFHLKIIFTEDKTLRKAFFDLVQAICSESCFEDDFLTRPEKSK